MMSERLERKLRATRRLPPPAERRRLREQAGLSQADIAGEFPGQVHPETVSRWERGERTPRGELLVKYVELLDDLRNALDVAS